MVAKARHAITHALHRGEEWIFRNPKIVLALAQYMRKGQQVTVFGQVTEREYTTKDGVAKKAFSVRVTDVALQGGKRDDDGGGGGTSYAPQSQPSARPATPQAARAAQAAADTDFEDSIPF